MSAFYECFITVVITSSYYRRLKNFPVLPPGHCGQQIPVNILIRILKNELRDLERCHYL